MTLRHYAFVGGQSFDLKIGRGKPII